MIWQVNSYIGAGNLLFGMSPSTVATFVGEPESTYSNERLHLREYRADVTYPTLDYTQDGLVEISFHRECKDLVFDGLFVFSENQHSVIERLIELDCHMLGEYYGIVVSLKLGISFSGFYHLNDSNKGFGCFRRGHWDNATKEMSPLPSKPDRWPTEEDEEEDV